MTTMTMLNEKTKKSVVVTGGSVVVCVRPDRIGELTMGARYQVAVIVDSGTDSYGGARGVIIASEEGVPNPYPYVWDADRFQVITLLTRPTCKLGEQSGYADLADKWS